MIDLSNGFIIDKKNEKRNRKVNAVKLPIAIDESMIPKYVVYYRECYNKQQQLYREFFKIEKHPKQLTKTVYTSSKSNKVTIKEKLQQIEDLLNKIEENYDNKDKDRDKDRDEDQDEDQYEDTETNNKQAISLPKYISLKTIENDKKYYLLYDKKILNLPRQTCKMLCHENTNFSQNLDKFLIKIDNRFNNKKHNDLELEL